MKGLSKEEAEVEVTKYLTDLNLLHQRKVI